MENNFQDSLSYIKHLILTTGELRFSFAATPYGLEFDWRSDLPESDSVEELEKNLIFF